MVAVLPEKCVGCGLCVQDCPMRNLSVADGKAKVRGTVWSVDIVLRYVLPMLYGLRAVLLKV